jgi:hypothetical protein
MVDELSSPDKWLRVSIAPFDVDLEVCVIDKRSVHPLVFPCRRAAGGWVDAATRRPLDIAPTHWRRWGEQGL